MKGVDYVKQENQKGISADKYCFSHEFFCAGCAGKDKPYHCRSCSNQYSNWQCYSLCIIIMGIQLTELECKDQNL